MLHSLAKQNSYGLPVLAVLGPLLLFSRLAEPEWYRLLLLANNI